MVSQRLVLSQQNGVADSQLNAVPAFVMLADLRANVGSPFCMNCGNGTTLSNQGGVLVKLTARHEAPQIVIASKCNNTPDWTSAYTWLLHWRRRECGVTSLSVEHRTSPIPKIDVGLMSGRRHRRWPDINPTSTHTTGTHSDWQIPPPPKIRYVWTDRKSIVVKAS